MQVEVSEQRDSFGLTVTVTVEAESAAEQSVCLQRQLPHRHSSMLLLDADGAQWEACLRQDDQAGAMALLRQGQLLWDQPFCWDSRPTSRCFSCSMRVPDSPLVQCLLADIRHRPSLQGVLVGLEHLAIESHNPDLSSAVAAGGAPLASATGSDRSA
jgi:hypothetical protein